MKLSPLRQSHFSQPLRLFFNQHPQLGHLFQMSTYLLDAQQSRLLGSEQQPSLLQKKIQLRTSTRTA